MRYLLETEELEKKYGKFKALNHLNMHVKKGAIYGLIGKNGAGKTTLIRVVSGLQKPSSGSYSLYGINNFSKQTSNKYTYESYLYFDLSCGS